MNRKLTHEVTVGDFLREDNNGETHFGEVVSEDHNTVTVLWDDGDKEHILKDMLDSPVFKKVSDQEAPTPKGFGEMLSEGYGLQ